MIKLRAKYHLSEKETELLKDTDTKESHYDYLIDYDCDCYLPNGEPLFFFRKNFIDYGILKEAYLNMLPAAKVTNNRGLSSSSEKKQATLKSGKKSKQVYIYDKETGERVTTNSGTAGYFDRQGRYDFCRTTAFNKDHLDKFEKALPLIHEVNRGFKEIVPDRYKKQLAMAKGTHPNYVIKDTAFTTLTINKNWRTPYHTDQGDYAKGFGNLVAYCKDIEPVLFIMPRFKIAIDLRTCDLLLADVHQYHGNSPIIKRSKNAVRLSFVMYYRENMIKCKSPSEELKRSQMNQRINFLKQSGFI
tara:strand:- start:2772 stop:3677 length:906 start_codon:yes stop_codon:yes gene_type:complete